MLLYHYKHAAKRFSAKLTPSRSTSSRVSPLPYFIVPSLYWEKTSENIILAAPNLVDAHGGSKSLLNMQFVVLGLQAVDYWMLAQNVQRCRITN